MAKSSLNSYNFTGNLGADPELRSLPSGGSVCRLRVAVARYGDKPPVWVDVSVFGPAAETCARYLAKGREVAVSGQVDEIRAYSRQNGEPGASLSVSTRDVTFIGGRDDGDGSGFTPRSDVDWGGDQSAPSTPAPAQAPPASPADDDIPF